MENHVIVIDSGDTPRKTICAVEVKFEDVMESARGYPLTKEGFREYLLTQHCEENIEFLNHVDMFAANPTLELAQQLCSVFIDDGGEKQINIPIAATKEIRSKVASQCVVLLYRCNSVQYG
eukprot:Phypoly_transcript_05442.p1 GENE.Phypoly_transcript_05442~~Phypoly_transcript_05442.p1  ORF type:complete len:121 (+),score=9.71 Phypoly_transcript_05442:103-465(+)